MTASATRSSLFASTAGVLLAAARARRLRRGRRGRRRDAPAEGRPDRRPHARYEVRVRGRLLRRRPSCLDSAERATSARPRRQIDEFARREPHVSAPTSSALAGEELADQVHRGRPGRATRSFADEPERRRRVAVPDRGHAGKQYFAMLRRSSDRRARCSTGNVESRPECRCPPATALAPLVRAAARPGCHGRGRPVRPSSTAGTGYALDLHDPPRRALPAHRSVRALGASRSRFG